VADGGALIVPATTFPHGGGRIILRPHLLSDRGMITRELPPGHTILEILDLIPWPEDKHDRTAVFVNGIPVEYRYWRYVRPKPHAHVLVAVRMHGGGGEGGGKNIFALVATIAIAAFAQWAAPALLGAGASPFAIGALKAGIMIVGALAINAMFAPSRAGNLGAPTTRPAETPGYALTGQSNQATPYQPCPRVYGTHRIFPRVGAQPVPRNRAGVQYLQMILDCGYGPLALTDLRIGETPISQYAGVRVVTHPNFVAGNALSIYSGDTFLESLAFALAPSVPVTARTRSDAREAILDFFFPRGLAFFTDQGDPTNAVAEIAVRVRNITSGGAWLNYTAFPVDIQFGRAVVGSTVDVTYDVHGGIALAWVNSFGDGEWGHFQIPAGTTSLIFLNQVAYTASPITPGFVPPVGSAAQIAGYWYTVTASASDITGGGHITISPGIIETIESLTQTAAQPPEPVAQIYIYDSTQPTIFLKHFRMQGATMQPTTFSMRVILDAVAEWEFEVTRIHSVATNRLVNDLSWTGLQSINPTQAPLAPVKPHTVIEIEVQATDQLQGVLANVSCLATSLLAIPTATGPGAVVATGNNAAIVIDILTGTGNPRPLAASRIDWERFTEWYDFCEDDPPDGTAAPRCRCDTVVDQRTTVRELIDSICSAGRATRTMRDGLHSVVLDQQRPAPVQVFTPANSWNFSATRAYPDPPHALKGHYVEPAAEWGEREVIVYRDGYDETTATIFEELQLYGITRSDQAYRDTRYFMGQAMLRREEAELECSIDNLVCLRGDLVAVATDVLKVGGTGTLVQTVLSSTVFTVTDPFDATGGPYAVRCRDADGILQAPVAAVPLDERTWDTSPTAHNVEAGNLIVWGEVGRVTGDYIVRAVRPGPDFTARLELVEDNPDVYALETEPIPPYTPLPGTPTAESLPQPAATTFVTVAYNGRRPVGTVNINWSWIGRGNVELVARRVSTTAAAVPLGSSTTSPFPADGGIDLMAVPVPSETRTYEVWVRNPATGTRSDPITITATVPHYAPLVPADPTNFTVVQTEARTDFDWDHLADTDLAHYEVRWGAAGATWATALTLATIKASALTWQAFAAGSYQALVRAVDVWGQLSNAATVAVTISPPRTPTGLAFTFNREEVIIAWTEPDPTNRYSILSYDIWRGPSTPDTAVGQSKTTVFNFFANWGGARRFWIRALDIAGNAGAFAPIDITINAPVMVGVTAAVIDNNVLLRWQAVAGELPIRTYHLYSENVGALTLEARRASPLRSRSPALGRRRRSTRTPDEALRDGVRTIPGTATYLGTNDTEFASIFERSSGLRRYYVQAEDTAGNLSNDVFVDAQINEPPDFVLYAEYVHLPFEETVVTNARDYATLDPYSRAVALAPLNLTETWAGHYSSHSWATPQAQIDAGFPIYAQPTELDAVLEWEHDIGVVLAQANVVINPVIYVESLTVAWEADIAVRETTGDPWREVTDAVSWTTNDVRYVRIRLRISSTDDKGLVAVDSVHVDLSLKFKTDTGTAHANASDTTGTPIAFTRAFYDVEAITCQVINSSIPLVSVIDFVDAPNPTGFSVYFYNLSGVRQSCDFFWTARGV